MRTALGWVKPQESPAVHINISGEWWQSPQKHVYVYIYICKGVCLFNFRRIWLVHLFGVAMNGCWCLHSKGFLGVVDQPPHRKRRFTHSTKQLLSCLAWMFITGLPFQDLLWLKSMGVSYVQKQLGGWTFPISATLFGAMTSDEVVKPKMAMRAHFLGPSTEKSGQVNVRRQDIHKQSIVVSPNWFGTGSKGEWFFKKTCIPKKKSGVYHLAILLRTSVTWYVPLKITRVYPPNHPFSPATEPAAGARTPGIRGVPAIFEGNTSGEMINASYTYMEPIKNYTSKRPANSVGGKKSKYQLQATVAMEQ